MSVGVYESARRQLKQLCFHTHKSAGVVVADGFSVPEGLEQRVGLQDDVFDALQVITHR